MLIRSIKNWFGKTKYILLLSVLAFSSLSSLRVSAVDYGFYSANDINFHDPNASCATNTTSSSSDGTLTGKNNREKIWCYLITVGKFSKGGAAGVMGNIARETGKTFEPKLWQKGGFCDNKASNQCGYGLLQWTDPGLKEGLWKFAHETFPNDTGKVGTLKTQLDYMLHSWDKDIGPTLLRKLRDPNITPADAAWAELSLYNCPPQYCPPVTITSVYNTIAVKAAKEYHQAYQNLPCGGSTTPTTTPTTSGTTTSGGSASGGKPKILLGPGHTGNDVPKSKYNGDPAVKDKIYANRPELQDVWDVSQTVKEKLEALGYEVLMTKNSAEGGTYQWNRAKQANDNNVDLAIEIHTSSPSGSFSSWGQTWSQYEGGYRIGKNGEKVKLVASEDVINKSKEYTEKITKARKEAGETGVVSKTTAGFYDAADPPGNITLVQLWSKVPWVYIEAGADKSKDNQQSGGITNAQKKIYAEGIVGGIVASIPPSGGTTDPCAGGTSGVVSGSILQTALNLAWPNHRPHPRNESSGYGREFAKPEYVKAKDKYNPEAVGIAEYTDCGVFVATVMRASGVDPKYQTRRTSEQDNYVQSKIARGGYVLKKVFSSGQSWTTADLKSGDIMINDGHTMIYVGKDGGELPIRQASLYTQAPNGQNLYGFGDYNIYRAS